MSMTRISTLVFFGFGISLIIYFINEKIKDRKVRKTYSENIFLIKQGMDIQAARKLMGEFNFKEDLGPNISYEVSGDSIVLIVLVYKDNDVSDGYPSIKFDPKSNKVVAVIVGEMF